MVDPGLEPENAGGGGSLALWLGLGLTALLVLALLLVPVLRNAGSAPGPSPNGEAADTVPPEPVRVEVLNGSGIAGLARDATHRLRAGGFDVVFFGNARRFDHEASVVVDRMGDTATARRVGRTLGIDSVTSEPDARLLLDVTVILGRDWPPGGAEPEASADRFRRRRMSDDATP